MSKAAELASLASASETALSNRNIVTNGAMQVAQRSVSVADLGANQSTCQTLDRWKFYSSSDGRLTMSQTADGPSGFANCMKLDCTTADTSIAASEYIILQHCSEGQDLQQIKKGTSDAESVTVSFYVKANAAFTFGVELYDNDNTRQITKLYNTTTGWVRHELTFPADTTGAFDDDNAFSLGLNFWLHAGSTFSGGTLNTSAWASSTNANRAAGIDSFFSSTDNNFFITGVQLEVGPVATPFEHRSVGQEMALAQRYYTKFAKIFLHGKGYQSVSGGVGLLITMALPTTMRASPTLAATGIVDGGSNATMVLGDAKPESFSVEAEGTTSNNSLYVYAAVTADAEL